MTSFLLIFATSLTFLLPKPQIPDSDSASVLVSAGDNAGKAKIVMEKQGQKLIIQGLFIPSGNGTGKFKYQLATFKAGKSGRSTNKQAGNFEVKNDQEPIVLSTSGLNLQASDLLDIELLVFQEDALIAKDVLHYQAR